MRSFAHWTPAYIFNRIQEIIYHARRPHDPWLTQSANLILPSYLSGEGKQGLEWGSGRSTLWFAARLARLTSVEHNPVWHKKVSQKLRQKKINNVEYCFFPYNQDIEDTVEAGRVEYVRVADRFAANVLDFVLIDGVYRSACALAVLDKIRQGGILVLDNANWFLPSLSISPCSRSFQQGPVSRSWEEFQNKVKSWRSLWTSSGVTDTAIWIKP